MGTHEKAKTKNCDLLCKKIKNNSKIVDWDSPYLMLSSDVVVS
jgi:hypothetical protein